MTVTGRGAVGVALLLLSHPTAAQTPVYDLGGQATGDGFGATVARLGDLSGDGFDDFIVGAPNASAVVPLGGRVRVYSGQTGAVLHEIEGLDPFGFLGSSVSAAPDFDGDGTPDFLLGVRGDDTAGSNAGVVLLYSGASGALVVGAFGDLPGDALGSSIAVLGDVDGDGHDDIAVGMPGSDGAAADGGGFRVYSGYTAEILFDFHGDEPQARLGSRVAPAGDVDDDGRADVLASTSSTSPGRVVVVSGATREILHDLRGAGGVIDFGQSLASLGDIDGDGHDDLAIGAPLADVGVPSGAVYVYSGKTGAELFFVTGDEAGDMLGKSVVRAGDVDGDGREDFAVGIPGKDFEILQIDDGGGPPVVVGSDVDVGEVRVYSGANGALLERVEGDTAGGYFGWTLAELADVNLDGLPELVGGALLADRGAPQSGAARVFSVREQTLVADVHEISLSQGGRQNLAVDLRSSLSGALYWIIGSGSGTFPGTPTNVGIFHLNADAYTTTTLASPNNGLITGPIGMLDADGNSEPFIQVPPATDPALEGVTLFHAVAVFDSTTAELLALTNAVPVTAVK